MKHMLTAAALLVLAASPALADGEFSAGSKAKSWNLLGEEKALFEGTVIDAICVLTGDCRADCGAGKRQMGILRGEDGRFLLVNKNGQAAFSGATADLAPYCGQTVEVDGLLVGDPGVTPGIGTAKVFQVQTVRVIDEDTVNKANRFTRDWKRRNPDAGGKGAWFRRDPNISAEIEANGRLGLGEEADRQYIEDNF